jgi:iron complex transport system ATP-binding protein
MTNPETLIQDRSASQASLIKVSHLGVSIDGRRILDDISFQVESGDFVSIIGPNGAGKSTLVKLLVHQLKPDTGEIGFLSRPVAEWHRKELARQLAYVPQTLDANIRFTVRDFVTMARYPHLSPFSSLSQHDRQQVDQALAMTNTVSYADQSLDRLSGGQRQTVLIAAALAQEAQILILDEPVTFLDPRHVDEICELLWKLNRQQGKTIVMVTHDINHAAMLSNKVLALKDGTLCGFGPTDQLIQNQMLETLFSKSFSFVPHPVTGQPILVPNFAFQHESKPIATDQGADDDV